MAARAMQHLRYHIAWVVLGHKHRNRNESGTITIKAKRQKKTEQVKLIRYFKVATNSSLSSSFMHIKIQYGCPKESLDCDLGWGFCCIVHKEPDFKGGNSVAFSATHKQWSLQRNRYNADLVKLKNWNVKLACLM